MVKVAGREDAMPSVADQEQQQERSVAEDVSSTGIRIGPRGGRTAVARDSSLSDKKAKKKRKRKKRKHYISSDTEPEVIPTSRPRRSCALSNGCFGGSPGAGGQKLGIKPEGPTRPASTPCAGEKNAGRENGAETSQKARKSGGAGAGASARARAFSSSEDDINMTVKRLQSSAKTKRRGIDSETATPAKKMKSDRDATERIAERVGKSPSNGIPRSRRKLVCSFSDDSGDDKEDFDMMERTPFSGTIHEGKFLDGCSSKLVVTDEDKMSTPLRKSSSGRGARGGHLPSRLLQHNLEKILPKTKGPKPNGINAVSRDMKKPTSSHLSHRKGNASHNNLNPACALYDDGSKLSVPKKRGRPKMNRDKDTAASETAAERLRECSTSKPARPAKSIPRAKGLRPILTEKQMLREKIKDLLLSAGWTIELHPRKGRNYLDSVYVPPEKTGGFWSITKAYAVYQAKMKPKETQASGDVEAGKPTEDNGTDPNRSESKPSVSELLSFDLGILKRNVVNKRRSKAELELIRASGNQARKKKGRKAVTKKKQNGFIVPRNYNSHSAFEDSLTPGRKRKNKRALLTRESSQDSTLDTDVYIPYSGKRTVLGWMLDSGVVSIDGKVKYMGKTQKVVPLEGRIKQEGIHCDCCNQVFTVSSFETHAGSELGRPFENTFVEELGLSFLECQVKAWQNQEESVRSGFYSVDIDDDPNDDTCGICGDGGELICCDSCPSTYHLGCLGLEMLPPGDWHCSYCSCIYCGAADSSCVVEDDDDKFNSLVCVLCERKYHQSCRPVDGNAEMASLFCGQTCSLIFIKLQKLLGIKNVLEDGFSWSLIQRVDDDVTLEHSIKANCNAKVAVALTVMDECFLPILDQRSGVNLIKNVVYNFRSNFNRLNYSGFFTFILERDDEIIAAASIRIHGRLLAEMPFIGTRSMYRRQGMCRRLLTAIEKTLYSLGVERLLIPAISELEETWTNIFGFRPLDDSFNKEVKSINLMVFPGTGLLEKQILKHEKAEAVCGASSISETEVVKDNARCGGSESLVCQGSESRLSVSPEIDGFMGLDKTSFEPVASICDSAQVPNDSSSRILQKDSVEMEKELTRFDMAAAANLTTHETDGCFTIERNCLEPIDTSSLLQKQDVSIRNPLTEGYCDATSVGMPHDASSSEYGGSVSLNGIQ